MAFQIGDRIFHGRYRVEAVLGHDESGTVYQAWDTRLEIPVAIHERLEQATAEPSSAHQAPSTGLGNSKAFTIPGQGQYHVIDYIAGEDLAHLLVRFHHMGRSKRASPFLLARPALEGRLGEAAQPAEDYPSASTGLVVSERAAPIGQPDETESSLLITDPPEVQPAGPAPTLKTRIIPGRWVRLPGRRHRRTVEPVQAVLWALAGLCLILLVVGLLSLVRNLPGGSRPAAALENAGLAPPLPGPTAVTLPVAAASTPPAIPGLPITGSSGPEVRAPDLQPSPQAGTTAAAAPTLPAATQPPTTTLAARLPAYSLVRRLAPPYPQAIRSVAEKDGYAYVLTRQGLLYTYDLTNLDPTQPPETDSAPLNQTQLANGGGLLRYADVLYAFGPSGLEVLDLSQPQQPALQYQQKDLEALNLFISGNRMVALGRGAIIVYDISQPLQPIVAGKLFTAPDEENFAGAIHHDILYVSTYWSDSLKTKSLLRVYQISPRGIKEAQRIDTGELAYHLLILDGMLVRCTARDVEAWELTRKDNPRFASSASAPAKACVLDGDNIVTGSAAFTLQLGQVRPVAAITVETNPAGPTRFEAYPYGAAAGSGLVLLAQPDQVLVVAGKSAGN